MTDAENRRWGCLRSALELWSLHIQAGSKMAPTPLEVTTTAEFLERWLRATPKEDGR